MERAAERSPLAGLSLAGLSIGGRSEPLTLAAAQRTSSANIYWEMPKHDTEIRLVDTLEGLAAAAELLPLCDACGIDAGVRSLSALELLRRLAQRMLSWLETVPRLNPAGCKQFCQVDDQPAEKQTGDKFPMQGQLLCWLH